MHVFNYETHGPKSLPQVRFELQHVKKFTWGKLFQHFNIFEKLKSIQLGQQTNQTADNGNVILMEQNITKLNKIAVLHDSFVLKFQDEQRN